MVNSERDNRENEAEMSFEEIITDCFQICGKAYIFTYLSS